jgi:hypothetical protein
MRIASQYFESIQYIDAALEYRSRSLCKNIKYIFDNEMALEGWKHDSSLLILPCHPCIMCGQYTNEIEIFLQILIHGNECT